MYSSPQLIVGEGGIIGTDRRIGIKMS